MRVLQEGLDLVTRSGVLVSLEQHRVGVCGGLEIGFSVNRVWVVDWVAGETVNDFVVDVRPPDCYEAIQGQFFLQVDQARGRQFVERLGVEDGDKGTMVDHQLKVGACKIEVRLVDGPDDCEQFDLCGGVVTATLCRITRHLNLTFVHLILTFASPESWRFFTAEKSEEPWSLILK